MSIKSISEKRCHRRKAVTLTSGTSTTVPVRMEGLRDWLVSSTATVPVNSAPWTPAYTHATGLGVFPLTMITGIPTGAPSEVSPAVITPRTR
jgi:hypothetical protein